MKKTYVVTDTLGNEYRLTAEKYRNRDGVLELVREDAVVASFYSWVSIFEQPETQDGDRS